MSTTFKVRHTQFSAPRACEHACEHAVEPVSVLFDDEEEALCDAYVVSNEDDIPALQEYLHELRMD